MSQGRLLVAIMLAVAAIAAGSDLETPRWRHHHGRGQHHHLPTPSPPAPPSPTPFVPTPPVPTPTPPAPTPEPCSCCDLCNIVPGPFLAAPGGVSSSAAPVLPSPPSPPSPPAPPVPVPAPPAPVVNCVTALAGLAPCSTFLTGRVGPPPTPQCACCNGLAAFLASARAAGAFTGGQRLRCLCPILHGDVNAVLAKPVDPVRVMYLPVACGVALPPETITICFGQHMPTVANLTSAGLLH